MSSLAASFLIALLVALLVAATPVEVSAPHVTLPLAKRINTSGGTIQLLKHDQARAAALKERGAAVHSDEVDSQPGNVDVVNWGVTYIINATVGTPPGISFNLIVDTGSSNTWVGAAANKPYQQSSTSIYTGQEVAVAYGSGSFEGMEYLDTVTLGPGLTITDQSIGAALESAGFENFDGILGIGPVGLTRGTEIPNANDEIPTVTGNLFTQGTIPKEVVSVFYKPTNTIPTTNGELTFGGTDSTKHTDDLHYVPLTATSPASRYWGIDQSITYNGETILAKTAGIVDTGTTLILIASNAFSAYQKATGATTDPNTGLLQITPDQYSHLHSLEFDIGLKTFDLVPDAQIWPRSLNAYIGGEAGSIYLIVGDIGSPSGQGLDFINGFTFLERYYSVFDTTNQQFGLARTEWTYHPDVNYQLTE